MDFTAVFAPLTGWLDAHPGAVAWALGWLLALGLAQTVKQFLPVDWSVTAVKRTTQAIAIGAGSLGCALLWPAKAEHGAIVALACGMSAPTAYTLIKAIIETRYPGLAFRLGWERVQARADGAPPPDAKCERPPE